LGFLRISDNTNVEDETNEVGPSYSVNEDKDDYSTRLESTNEIIDESTRLAAARQPQPAVVSPPAGKLSLNN